MCKVVVMALTLTLVAAVPSLAQKTLSEDETQQIAEEAFIYGFPIVMSYGVFYEYFVDKSSPSLKVPINQLYNTARVYTPQDTTIVTPNSDTPYSFVAMDLRAEPYVVCNPEIEKSRYFAVQLVDMYTFNFGYMGSRTTGNGAACFMIAGPGWKGEKLACIAKVFSSETDFATAIIRTQLFDAADLENVKKIQAGYRAMTLSQFLKQPAPPAAPEIAWPKVDKSRVDSDPFAYLNFVLQFCPPTGPAEVEAQMRARFARIGIEAGKPFAVDKLTPEQKAELKAGMKNGIEKIKQQVATFGTDENGWRVTLDGFGDRQAYAGQLIANPIDRYLINSPMLPSLKTNSDGSLTLYLQKETPGADKESNWLPAPDGPPYLVMRLYWPKADPPTIYDGTWKPPAVQRIK